ncbi:MAG: ABC transporter ATP-binding protein [Gammaproteobacteria bacterium]|nr:ABC transporter ATP-binding protein [Gammaproteobacteria bacterium]
MALLSINNLSIELAHDQTQLVKQVSFDISKGEIFALVGESGSGKSLTALSILRLLPDALKISHGNVMLAQRSLFSITEQMMNGVRGKDIAMIFQDPQTSLNPVQTIKQQIGEVLRIHQGLTLAQAEPRIIELLTEVGIPEPQSRLSWYPHQLSGGQKQRVMIAIALACNAKLLIADEPTTALDVTIQKQVLSLLKKLCKRHQLAMLLITHDMGVVFEMADTVAVMRQGKIVEHNNTKDFFNAPQHPYSQQLINSLPDGSFFTNRASEQPLLEVSNLHVWFEQRKGLLQRVNSHTKAVDGISFVINKGETLALVGESGSGKTTAGQAILNLIHTTKGNIVFNGKVTSQLSARNFMPYRKDIQVIFQDPFSSMNPRMTINDIIEEGMVSLKVEPDKQQRQQQINSLIKRVGLEPEHLNRYPHEFSGGQRQRIAIARALAVKPKLIICDEPTSALDVSIRGQVLDLLLELQQEHGLSYLFITHDLSLIPQLAHKMAVMKDGKIVEQGLTQQVMQNPQHAYTKELLSAVPKIERLV